MAGKTLGIEIGDHNLKIYEVSGRRVRNVAVAQILPDAIVQNGRIMAYNAMGSLIAETLKDHKIRTRVADIVLPMDTYIVKRVQMPLMTVKQLQVNLPYEFHDYINEDMSHFVFDYAVLDIHDGKPAQDGGFGTGPSGAQSGYGAGSAAQNGAGMGAMAAGAGSPGAENADHEQGAGSAPQPQVMDLLIAACRKDLVANYKMMCKRAGLKLNKLVPDVLALQTIVIPPEEVDERAAMLAAQEEEDEENRKKAARAAARDQRRRSKRDQAVENELASLGVTKEQIAEQAAASKEGAEGESAMLNYAALGVKTQGTAGSSNPAGTDSSTGSHTASGPTDGIASGTGSTAGSTYNGSRTDSTGSAGGSAYGTIIGSGGREGASTSGNAAGSHGTPPKAAAAPEWQDYAVLDFGHTGTRLHFFSKGAYEITRTMNTNARSVAEELAQERSIDIHIAELMLENNQDDVLHEPLITDAYDTMATEIQRVMNFYSYSNPRNTIEKIYYFGDGLNVDEMKSRITESIGLELHPITELIPEAADRPELLLAPQAYGCIFE